MGKKALKTVVGIGAAVAAGKIAYDKYKVIKEEYAKEEEESAQEEVRKYTSAFDKKLIEIEDEQFRGCEIKATASSLVLDLGMAKFAQDEYVNFTAKCSTVTIIVPEGVNVSEDIEKKASNVSNLVDDVEDEGAYTLFIIGDALMSNIEIVPVNFYVDDEDDFEDESEAESEETKEEPEETQENSDGEITIEIVPDEKPEMAEKEDEEQK